MTVHIAGNLAQVNADIRNRAMNDARQGDALRHLSMGMPSDYETAVEAGATIVRVGRAVFGPRPLPYSRYWPDKPIPRR